MQELKIKKFWALVVTDVHCGKRFIMERFDSEVNALYAKQDLIENPIDVVCSPDVESQFTALAS